MNRFVSALSTILLYLVRIVWYLMIVSVFALFTYHIITQRSWLTVLE
jgi:hypothetical protein